MRRILRILRSLIFPKQLLDTEGHLRDSKSHKHFSRDNEEKFRPYVSFYSKSESSTAEYKRIEPEL